MLSFLSFEGVVGRRGYALQSTLGWLAPPLVACAAAATTQEGLPPWWVWFNPLRAIVTAAPQGPSMFAFAAAVFVLSGWVLVAAAVRRARATGLTTDLAIFALVPVIQLPVIAGLLAAPTRTPVATELAAETRDAAMGLLVGVGMSVAAVFVSATIFGRYGYGLFMASPLVIGAATAYLANRHQEVGASRTVGIVSLALFGGGLALLATALEGVMCLVMAAPLIWGVGMIGMVIGRGMAASRVRPRSRLLSSALAPAVILADFAFPPHASFESVESVEVAAPPAAVWDSIVHMGPIRGAPAAPFRWGLAYPLRGRILGEGPGAIREGVFSTGVAYERVTVWRPGRQLDFIVLSDPPSMRELSPYPKVDTPHVRGYFRTLDARFTLTPLGPDRTRLTLATRHELDLDPAPYWLPFVQWAVHANKVRVLQHFRQQAERY